MKQKLKDLVENYQIGFYTTGEFRTKYKDIVLNSEIEEMIDFIDASFGKLDKEHLMEISKIVG